MLLEPSCARVNLLSDAVKATMSITAHAAARRELDKFQPRFLTIADLYQLDAVGNLLLQQWHAFVLLCTRADDGFMVTRSTTRVYVSLRRAKVTVHGPKDAADLRIEGMTEGRQRRDISTLELGQWPCALKSYVLILLNLAHTCSTVALIHLRRLFRAVPDVRNPSLKTSRCISN